MVECILTNFRFGLSSQASINWRYTVRYPVRANLNLDTYCVEIMIRNFSTWDQLRVNRSADAVMPFVMFILLEHKQGFLFILQILFSVSNLGVVNSRLNSRDPGRRHKIIVSRWSQQGISRSMGRQKKRWFHLKIATGQGTVRITSQTRFLAVRSLWTAVECGKRFVWYVGDVDRITYRGIPRRFNSQLRPTCR